MPAYWGPTVLLGLIGLEVGPQYGQVGPQYGPHRTNRGPVGSARGLHFALLSPHLGPRGPPWIHLAHTWAVVLLILGLKVGFSVGLMVCFVLRWA